MLIVAIPVIIAEWSYLGLPSLSSMTDDPPTEEGFQPVEETLGLMQDLLCGMMVVRREHFPDCRQWWAPLDCRKSWCHREGRDIAAA
ncbi:hypothetical protein U1Q18_024341 [Sarracenia purpurea var. burkii]